MKKSRGRGRPENYQAYVKAYNSLKKAMEAKGLKMADKKMNKTEWNAMRVALTNERKEQIKQGKRKTVGNINRDLAKSQQYQYTQAQAKAWRKSIEETEGKKVTLADIRGARYTLNWNAISEREHDLRDQGLGWALVHQIIAQEYFGSE